MVSCDPRLRHNSAAKHLVSVSLFCKAKWSSLFFGSLYWTVSFLNALVTKYDVMFVIMFLYWCITHPHSHRNSSVIILSMSSVGQNTSNGLLEGHHEGLLPWWWLWIETRRADPHRAWISCPKHQISSCWLSPRTGCSWSLSSSWLCGPCQKGSFSWVASPSLTEAVSGLMSCRQLRHVKDCTATRFVLSQRCHLSIAVLFHS